MDNVEQILLKMLPGKEERDTYTVFTCKASGKHLRRKCCQAFQAREAGKQSFIY